MLSILTKGGQPVRAKMLIVAGLFLVGFAGGRLLSSYLAERYVFFITQTRSQRATEAAAPATPLTTGDGAASGLAVNRHGSEREPVPTPMSGGAAEQGDDVSHASSPGRKPWQGRPEEWRSMTGYAVSSVASFAVSSARSLYSGARNMDANERELLDSHRARELALVHRATPEEWLPREGPWTTAKFQIWGFSSSVPPAHMIRGRDFLPTASAEDSLAWYARESEELDPGRREEALRMLADAERDFKHRELSIVQRACELLASGEYAQESGAYIVQGHQVRMLPTRDDGVLQGLLEELVGLKSKYTVLAREVLR